ncbi:MFS transporter [Candidatus Daviesbacteria bacterium]|nr:MFS transporter [Candidatus Daviesbacteria bacterium]
MEQKPSFASVLHNRGFLNLWVNQILVQLSYNALNFALIIWVFQLTGSNTAVAALLLAVYLPAVLLGLFTGVLVDLMDRKKIIMLIDFFLCLSFFSLIFFKGSYPAILAVAFFVNALGQFYAPAEASAIPLIVKRPQLLTANSFFSITLYSCFLLGFGLAGPFINHFGINMVFALGGLFLALAFLLAFTFPSIRAKPDEQGRKLVLALKKRDYNKIWEVGLYEMIETANLIRGKLPVLSSILILAGVQMVIGVLAVLMPALLERTLHIKATDASYILIIPLGAGIITGGLILSRIGHLLVRRRVVAKAILAGGLLFSLMGVAPIISPAIKYLPRPEPLPFFYQPPLSAVAAFSSFLLGMVMVSILVPSQTVLQENTPEDMRGKVFSVLGVAMAGLSLIPVLLSGIMADIFGPTPIFLALGIIIMLAGIFGLKPSLFFPKTSLSYRVREFLGLGHWEGK